MKKNISRYDRRKSYSALESQSLFKPVAMQPELKYSAEGIATNLDEVLTRQSPLLDVFLEDEINRNLAKQKQISDTLQKWQENIRSTSLTTMPILEENSENDKSDDEGSRKDCRTVSEGLGAKR